MTENGRIPAAVGALLDQAQAEVSAAENALALARVRLERLVRVHLLTAGVDAASVRVDRDGAGWFHRPLERVG